MLATTDAAKIPIFAAVIIAGASTSPAMNPDCAKKALGILPGEQQLVSRGEKSFDSSPPRS